MRIIMVRHGEAQNNVDRVLAGRQDGVMLTPLGVKQAQYAAQMLGTICNEISAIYSSPVTRAFDTACMISQQCCNTDVVVDERLTEIDMGKFTGMSYADVALSHGDLSTKFYQRDIEIAHMGVETFEQVRKRVLDIVCGGVMHADDTGVVIMVTHMDPIKIVLGEATKMPIEQLLRTSIKNASLNVFDMEGTEQQQLSLLALNVMEASRFILS